MYQAVALSPEFTPQSTSDGAAGFSVLTLNCWALPGPWPIGSTERLRRLETIAEQLCLDRYDVVGLQEIYLSGDYEALVERTRKVYPFAHYFHAGFIGSGVCVLSRHPIVSTLMHRYSLNGFAHHLHRGDWYSGKVIGMVELEVGDARVHFYSTHLHAEYDREEDLYLAHRLSQAFELSQFVRHTSVGADLTIVSGDLNMQPQDLGLRLILSNAQLGDAWKCMHVTPVDNGGLANGMTCGRPDNSFTPRAPKNEMDDGQRLDYILYKNGESSAEVLECETTFHRIPGENINFSDHCGVYARFLFGASKIAEKCEFESNIPLVKEAIEHVSEGEQRACRDRRLFIGLFAVLLIVIFLSLALDAFIPVLTSFFSLIRFIMTLVAAFCIWHGVVGSSLELKALEGAKQAMQKLLNA